MTATLLSEKAAKYLRRLCLEIPTRRVGSQGNRAATDFFGEMMISFGFETEFPMFDCLDWTQAGAQLAVDSTAFEIAVSPYSPGCHCNAPLVLVSTVEELEAIEASQQILLLHGDIAKEQLMPKNFPFYNPDEHKRIIHLLESKRPQAIIAATSRNPEMVGALYPFPLIEDGDFDIPSVYMTEEEGIRLAQHAGREVWLDIQAQRSQVQGCNVIARKGVEAKRRVVLCAHIDAKEGTPGAIDNATGVVALLLLAELLAGYAGSLDLEIVAMNGEDYYSNPGEQQYLSRNTGSFAEIMLGINLDGLGYHQGNTAYSLYDCPVELADLIRQLFSTRQKLIEGEPWYQGDHVLFLLNQRPALAFTSEQAMELLAQVVHTSKDRPEIVDVTKLVTVALTLRDLLLHLGSIHIPRKAARAA